MAAEVEIRLAYVEDIPFIFATWLRSYRHSSNFARKISNDIFYKRHHMVIDLILKRTGSTVLVAHPIGEPDVILGYLVSETQNIDALPVVHYTYVKRSFRQMGIAKALWKGLEDTPVIATHYTVDMDWLSKKHPKIMYDPYRI